MSMLVNLSHNVETGEVIEIPLTADEIKEVEEIREEAGKNHAALKLDIEIQQVAKASRDAKLAKMGFTLAEIENW